MGLRIVALLILLSGVAGCGGTTPEADSQVSPLASTQTLDHTATLSPLPVPTATLPPTLAPTATVPSAPIQLTILHTNDNWGETEPCGWGQFATGGFRRRATYIDEQRQKAEHLLLLDAGDALIGGGVLGDETKGEVIVAGMNLMGYDAMALGPGDLSLGEDLVRQRMAEAEFPMLSANVVLRGSEELFAEPFRIVEIEGRTIGVIGLTRVPVDAPDGFDVLDPEETLERYVPEVAEQAEVVIVLTNMAYPTGLALAAAVPEIDLLIAGRAESIPNKPVQVPSTGTLAVTTEPPAVRHTGRQVGTLTATLGSDGSLSVQAWQARPLGPQIPDDMQMKALLDSYR